MPGNVWELRADVGIGPYAVRSSQGRPLAALFRAQMGKAIRADGDFLKIVGADAHIGPFPRQ